MIEYAEWHLTPRGWERGSEQTPFGGLLHIDPPADRVMTCRRTVAGVVDIVEEQWRSPDRVSLERLLAKYGRLAP